jgi:uncharacterized protein (UPF0212 family)
MSFASTISHPVESIGTVYCPMCTHTVDATIVATAKHAITKPGQKCPRCKSALDAGYVMRMPRAA